MLEEIFKNPKEKTDFIIAIVVVCLFGGAILYGSMDEQVADDRLLSMLTSAESESVEVEETVEVLPVDLEIDDQEPLKATDEVDAIEPWTPVVISTGNVVKSTPELDNQETIIFPTKKKVDEIKKEPESIVNETVSSASNTPTSTSDSKEVTAIKETTAPTSKEVETAEETAINQTGECQIVVGAYSTEANRQRMIDQLMIGNFVTYTYKQRGLYVASVKVSCDKDIRRRALKEIQKNYAKGAFVPRK